MSTAAQPGRADNNSSGSATHNLIRNGNAQPVKKDEEMLADLQSNEPSPSLPERFQGLLKRKRNRIISMYVAHKCQGVLSGGILKLRKANERHLNESKLSSEYVIELDKVLIFFNDRKRYIKLKFQKEAHILAPIYTTRDHEKRVRLYEAWKNAFTRHRRYRQGQVRDGLAANSSVANNSTLPSRSKTTRNNTADKRFAIVQPLNSNDKPLAKGISPRRKLPRQVTLDGATLPAFDSTVSKPAANGRRNDATPDERSEREKKTSRAVERVENLRAKNRVLLADIKKSHEIVKNTIFSAGSSDEDDEDEDEDSASDWANTAVTASPTAKQNTPRNAHKNLEETLNTTAIAGVEARQPAARPDEAVDTNGGNAKKLQLTSAVIADGRPPKGDASKGAPNAGSQLPPEIISTMLNEVNQMLIEMKQMYDHLKLKAGKPVANFEELPATKTTTTTPTGLVNAFGVKPQADSKNATTKAGIEPSAANSQPKVLVETESCKVIASPMSVSLRLGVSPMTPSKLSTTPTTAVTTTASSEVTAIWNGAPQHRLPRSRRSLLPAVQVDLQPIPFMAIAMGRLPIWAYEPLGALQILCEELRFASDLLSRAVSCDTSATLRMAHVAAFVLSGYTSLVTHKQKPFNPLRGETFDYVSDDGWQFHAEQVSHHPPISAAFAHHRDWEWHNCCKGDTRLTINGMGELIYKFPLVIYLNKFNEVYTYNKVKTLIINPLKCANRRVIRQEGLVTIQCSNGLECRMAFNNCAENSVSGSVYENHKVALRLVGNWDKGLSCIYDNGEQCRLFEAPAIVRELADRYYGFNPFSVTLNELHAEEVPHLPSTDSRFRPDQRYLEQGEVQKATDAKYTLEKNQRRREVLVPNFQPMWFHQTSASLNTSVANSGAVRNEGMWWTNAKYWESRALRFQDSYSSRMTLELWEMVPPIPIEHREEIVKLRDAGYSFRNIRDVLMQKGVKYSVIGIGNCYQKIIKNGSIDAQPKQKYSKEMLERIKQELQSILEENSDLTGQQQIDEIKRRLGVTVSMDAVGRYRRMLGWKVMPVASNKSGNKSLESNGGSSSPSGLAGADGGAIPTGGNVNGSEATSGEQHHQQRTSGYYLHPPDVLLPPELSTVAASLPTLGNGGGGSAAESATSAAFRLANDAVQQRQQQEAAAAASNAAGGTVVVGNGEMVTADGKSIVKAEYGVASTSNVPAQMQLIHTSQGQIIAHAEMSDGVGGTASSSQMQANSAGGMPLNTAIVYPLKQPKFGPMHVFTSRAIIKTGLLKYQVWAGISSQGATSICIWDANCRMRSQFYCSTILEKFYLPFCAERYANKRCILVQSNDPIYRSLETKAFMEQHGIVADTWVSGQYGAESNPIELIWDEIGDHIKNEVKPRSLDELRDAICNFWATKMTDTKCRLCLKKCSIFSEY